jgi:hypothetical protein
VASVFDPFFLEALSTQKKFLFYKMSLLEECFISFFQDLNDDGKNALLEKLSLPLDHLKRGRIVSIMKRCIL